MCSGKALFLMDTSLSALQNLLDIISTISKDVSTEMARRPHQMMPIRTTFVHLRPYYGKVYYLAKYICDEEQYSIQAVEEGKVEDIQDFLGEVVCKAENCKKVMETLIEYLETERQTLLQQGGVVKKRKDNAQSTKVIGIGTTIIGVIILAGSGLLAIRSNDDTRTLAFVRFFAIAVTSAGIFFAIKGSSAKSNNQDDHYRVVFAIDQMKSFFNQSETKLHTANNRLKSATNLIQPAQLQGSRSAKSSIVQDIRGVAESARSLKEYCQEFKDASSLEQFVSYHTSKNTTLCSQ